MHGTGRDMETLPHNETRGNICTCEHKGNVLLKLM